MGILGERWDFPQDYVDRVGQAAKANDMEVVMALHQEGFEHGDALAYTFAFRKFLMQDAEARIKAAEPRSLTWDEVVGHTLFEPILWPETLFLAVEHDVLKNEEEFRKGLVDAWIQPEWPERYLDTSIWLDYFAEAGFVTGDEGEPGEQPTEPVVLWRGAAEEFKNGMSWTGWPHVANWFAKRFDGSLGEQSQPVKVYRCTVPGDALLAHFEGRGEDEWVVDPYFLEYDEEAVIEEFEIDSLPEFAKPRQTTSVSADQEEGE